MTNNPQFQRPSFQFKGPKSPLAITAGILVAIGVLFTALSGFYADWLWFKSVNFTNTWSTILTTKATLFVVSGLLTTVIGTYNGRRLYANKTLETTITEVSKPEITKSVAFVVRIVDQVFVKSTDLNHNQSA